MIAFEGLTQVALLIHGLVAVVLVGSATHHGLISLVALLGKPARRHLQQVYGAVVAVTFGLTFGFGLVVYPTFRVRVRATWLDATMPFGTALFETKEHWLALALPLVTYIFVASRGIHSRRRGHDLKAYDLLSVILMIVILFAVIVGELLVTTRAT